MHIEAATAVQIHTCSNGRKAPGVCVLPDLRRFEVCFILPKRSPLTP